LQDEGLWWPTTVSNNLRSEPSERPGEASAMRHFLTRIAVALMLIGAVMLVADVGVAGLWIAVITIGIALVAIDAYRQRQGQQHT
jgi:hypothetical protein